MTNFFKCNISHRVMDTEKGVSKKNDIKLIIDGVNYQDAETTTLKLIEYFHLDIIDYKLDKLRISDLIIDDINTSFTEENELTAGQLNKMVVASYMEDSLSDKDSPFGVYKLSFQRYTIDNKLEKFNCHILTKDFDTAKFISEKFIKKYYDDGEITDLKRTPEQLVVLSEDKINTATDIYTQSTGNSKKLIQND